MFRQPTRFKKNKLPELEEFRPKSSKRDIEVTRPRLWSKSRDETETWTCRDETWNQILQNVKKFF